jgi:quercetin dioxygenase-like cupin family protein
MMKIAHYTEMDPGTSSGPNACAITGSGVTGRVVIGRADGAGRFCMRVFELAPGARSARHTHDWEHEVFVHAGEGAVLREGAWVPFRTGSVVFIPPGEEHQLENTGTEMLVFVCVIPAGSPEL